ncbi:MAG: hypothetical protein AAGB34_04915 [Planctomycetota bacterium]
MRRFSQQLARPFRAFHRDRAGVVSLEFLLVAFIIFSFMTLAEMAYRASGAALTARHETHRKVFNQATTFFDTSVNINLDLGPLNGLAAPYLSPDFFSQPGVEAATPDYDNPGTTSPNNGIVRGIGEGFTQLWYGPPIVVGGFDGSDVTEYAIAREAYTIRPPWTWGAYPGVYTQDFRERDLVRDFYRDMRDSDAYSDWSETLELRGGFTNDPDQS